MLLWSALILVMTVIGYAPLLRRAAADRPLHVHASWHAYRDLIR